MTSSTLSDLAERAAKEGIKAQFEDPKRVSTFSFSAAGVYADLSKTHITCEIVEHYQEIAERVRFEEKRRQQFSGERINVTEDRAVLHTLLRDTACTQVELTDLRNQEEAKQSQAGFLDQVDIIRDHFLSDEQPIKSIVHIGIGGSSLGPQLLYEALVGNNETIEVHFVSNIDAHQILSVLSQCEPESTLIFGVSKTFTTAETLMNIETAKAWITGGDAARFRNQFFAITANQVNAANFGVKAENIVVFPEWVGGRYSIWSAVSLSVALVLGREEFTSFLAGAAEMDREFYQQPLSKNLAFLLAAMDHFYCNYLGAASKATFAYDHRLRTLVPYLQQLETESNGKDRDIDGNPVSLKTSPVVWGGTGTDMQHSTFQLLHQGTQFIPVEFILIKEPSHDLYEHHNVLLANGVAQSAALLSGRSIKEVDEQPENAGLSNSVKRSKVFSGNKPSSTFILDALTPAALGAILALYEHRTFCGGVLAGINSFDQMGVELGKKLATDIEPILHGESSSSVFDSSTLRLLDRLQGK